MRRKALLPLMTLLILLALSACGVPVEEQLDNGMKNVETTFNEGPKETNTEIGKINVFLPTGYTIEESEDHTNYLLKKGDHHFILFVNPNEQKNSHLLYDLFKENQAKEIVEEKKLEAKDSFGFTAILENDEDSYELIVGSGGVKISTLSSGKNMDVILQEMMQIAHSVTF